MVTKRGNSPILEESAGNNLIEEESIIHKGKLSVDHELRAKHIGLTGKIRINGGISSDTFEGLGSIKINGKILSKKITCKGDLTGFDEIQAEELHVYGRLFGETVYSKTAEIQFSNESTINTIESEEVKILKKEGTSSDDEKFFNSLINKIFKSDLEIDFSKHKDLEFNFQAKKIKGKFISVEYTHCNEIEGESIIIGPGCQIDTVSFKDNLRIDPTSQVKKQIKL